VGLHPSAKFPLFGKEAGASGSKGQSQGAHLFRCDGSSFDFVWEVNEKDLRIQRFPSV
jgi:hypothetical protein